MAVLTAVTDEHLAWRASQGDKDALGDMYQRHFRSIYDLSVRMVRDRDLALDVVQNTFVSAWESLQKRTVNGNIKAWLYTIARNSAIDELRRTKRLATDAPARGKDEDSRLLVQIDGDRMSNPEGAAEDQEMVDLVWSSAAALSPREYSLLDLHLRRGLSTNEMAASLGVAKGNLYTMLSRLKDSLEQSVTAALLMRRGRRDCSELDSILSRQLSGEFTRETKDLIARHTAECLNCEDSRKRYLSPAEIFAGLALVPVPEEARLALWMRISPAVASGGAAVGLLGGLFEGGARWWNQASAPVQAAAASGLAAVVVVPIIATLLLVPTGGDDGPGSPAVAAASRSPAATDSSPAAQPATITPTPTPAVAGVGVTPRAPARDPRALEAPTPTPTPTPQVPVDVTGAPAPGFTPTPTPIPPPTIIDNPPSASPVPTPTPTPLLLAAASIRVGNAPKGLNLNSNEIIKIELLSNEVVAAADVDVGSLRLAGAAPTGDKLDDADRDGDPDLLLDFRISDTSVDASDTFVCLSGRTVYGLPFIGCDAIRILS